MEVANAVTDLMKERLNNKDCVINNEDLTNIFNKNFTDLNNNSKIYRQFCGDNDLMYRYVMIILYHLLESNDKRKKLKM